MGNKIKHLEMIQNVINRMASNSFMLKGWTVTLVVATFTLLYENTSIKSLFVAIVPIVLFWGLDAYYLMLERLYRRLYTRVQKQDENEIDFSMNISEEDRKDKKCTFTKCIFSPTEIYFYLMLVVLSIAVFLLTNGNSDITQCIIT